MKGVTTEGAVWGTNSKMEIHKRKLPPWRRSFYSYQMATDSPKCWWPLSVSLCPWRTRPLKSFSFYTGRSVRRQIKTASFYMKWFWFGKIYLFCKIQSLVDTPLQLSLPKRSQSSKRIRTRCHFAFHIKVEGTRVAGASYSGDPDQSRASTILRQT